MAVTINNAFRPLRPSDTVPGKGITAGGSTTPPAFLGTVDIARNANAIAAYAGNPCVLQVVPTSAYSAGGTAYTAPTAVRFATYMISVPAIREDNTGATILRIDVAAATTTATHFQIRGIGAGTGSWSSVTASASTATAYVDATPGIDLTDPTGADDTLRKISIEIQLTDTGGTETTGTFLIEWISIVPAFASEEYASAAAAFKTGVIQPQDDAAWDVDSPLNVKSVRELVAGNNYCYYLTHRHVANLCIPLDQATTNHAVGLSPNEQGIREPLMQFMYWPRAGVRNLAVSIQARVASSTSTVTVGWDTNAGDSASVSVSVSNTTVDWANWTAENVFLPVPRASGARTITIYGEEGAGALFVQAISIIEIVERVQ